MACKRQVGAARDQANSVLFFRKKYNKQKQIIIFIHLNTGTVVVSESDAELLIRIVHSDNSNKTRSMILQHAMDGMHGMSSTW